MLISLGDALGGWTPRLSTGDPLSTIRSAWTELVGIDVARAAQPVAITGETLVVITTSSAWSHQLVFLEPRIIMGIGSLVDGPTVTRLRFRVGTIRRRLAGTLTRTAVSRTVNERHVAPPPRDAREALDRFRATVQRSRDQHRARGGTFCADCGVAIGIGSRCVPCADWRRTDLESRCQRLLFDAPWMQPKDVLEMLPGLDVEAYDTLRRQLLRAWWDEMVLARKRAELPRPVPPDRIRLRKIASSFVLLETKIDPNRLELDSAVRRNALGDLYEFIREVERDD